MKLRSNHTVWMLSVSLMATPMLIAQAAVQVEPAETPQKVDVCDLLIDKKVYDHKLVQVTGLASHGFEDSTFSSPECNSRFSLWMEYGGTRLTGTMSTVSDYSRDRSRPAIVDGIEIPLIDDSVFRDFDETLHKGPSAVVHATVIARFFAQKPDGGYGHLGGSNLLIVQQVLSVDANRNPQLDPSDTPEQPHDKSPMGYLRFGDGDLYIFKAQKQADEGVRPYAFSDPQQVAIDFLAEETRIDASLFHLHPIRSTPARVIYEGNAGGSGRTYWVVVSKQAWLAFYAKNPAKIVWAVIGAFQYGGDT